MMKLFKQRYKIAFLVVLVFTLAAATYGFAASNTVPETRAGEGNNTISGYVVSNVDYTLLQGDPTQFSSVSFDLDNAADEVYVGIGSTTKTYWTDCGNGGSGNSWTCDLTGSTVSVLEAVSLNVSSAD